LITPPETGVSEKKSTCQIQNLNLPGGGEGGVSNWCRLGYELFIENITTDVV